MNPFDIENIKTFKLSDLHGKEVTLSYGEDGNYGVLVACDKKDNKIYIIADETKEEN